MKALSFSNSVPAEAQTSEATAKQKSVETPRDLPESNKPLSRQDASSQAKAARARVFSGRISKGYTFHRRRPDAVALARLAKINAHLLRSDSHRTDSSARIQVESATVCPLVYPQNNQIPDEIVSIINPVTRGIGKCFPPGFNTTVIGTYHAEGPGEPLGKTIRHEENRTALVLLNLNVESDIDNATADQRQASYAATLAHEYLRHVLPFMQALARGVEEEDDDDEHRAMFLPSDIDKNVFYRKMLAVCDELPQRLQKHFMQSYVNSVASHMEKLADDDENDEAEDFLDDIINSHGLKWRRTDY